MTAAAALERAMRAPSPEQLSVYGALHLAAATAAAACYDRATTETVLATARGVAGRTGETNHLGTAFGPVNVAIHALSASLRLGDPRTATQTGEAFDTAAMPAGLVGRRTQVNLDLARPTSPASPDVRRLVPVRRHRRSPGRTRPLLVSRRPGPADHVQAGCESRRVTTTGS
jgi:hypothetical protein